MPADASRKHGLEGPHGQHGTVQVGSVQQTGQDHGQRRHRADQHRVQEHLHGPPDRLLHRVVHLGPAVDHGRRAQARLIGIDAPAMP